MFSLIKKLIGLLTPQQRKRLFVLQGLVVLMAIMEVVSVVTIGPFIAVIGDTSVLEKNNFIAQVYQISGITHFNEFIFLAGLTVLIFLTVAALTSMLTVWRLAMFSTQVGAEIGDRLYRYYLYQSWLFHSSGSSAQLTKQIATETNRITNQVLNPLMQMNAKLVMAFFMLAGLFTYNSSVTCFAVLIFASAYLFLFKVVRSKLSENGTKISKMYTERYKLMSQGFGGIKDILLMGRQSELVKRFITSGTHLAESQGTNQSLAQAPRYLMELIAYTSVISLILFLIKTYDGDLGQVLPVLAIYALAGFKLLPALQGVYANIAAIKGGMAAFESVRTDLENSQNSSWKESPYFSHTNKKLSFQKSLKLEDVTFSYPGKNKSAIEHCSLEILNNKTVGIVGVSGSGKSTIIDLILGLISPDTGKISVDNVPLNSQNIRPWQNVVGFVAQSIFLADGTIKENIAFGLPEEKIDQSRICKAIELAHLKEFIVNLEDREHTMVGERGVQLSGGQRQRIGIARALYQDASVLVFDEATSALDGLTERHIMQAIQDLSGTKTIILVAHRLKTVQQCDIIYLVDKGRVIDQGKFEELINRNDIFRNMAQHA